MDPVYPKAGVLHPEPETGPQESVLSVLLQAFDIRKDDADLRALENAPPEKAAESFERLRTRHPLRPEFRHFIVDLDKTHINLADTFAALGFEIRTIQSVSI